MISCYFVTGTGRCGTQLLSKILNCSGYTHCNHEYSIDTQKLKKSFYKNKPEILIKDIDRTLKSTIVKYNNLGKIYGECSGHLYPIFPELYRRYENAARFVLLVRNPVDFVRSALARGFFDPNHRHALEHLIPPGDTTMGLRWSQASPLEKCAWYWATVNSMVYRFFLSLPHTLWRILPIESLSMEVIKTLYDHLCLKDFEQAKPTIENLLSIRHNASPGQGDESDLNPFSKEVTLGKLETWSSGQIAVFEKHVLPMQEIIYGKNDSNVSYFHNLSFLR